MTLFELVKQKISVSDAASIMGCKSVEMAWPVARFTMTGIPA